MSESRKLDYYEQAAKIFFRRGWFRALNTPKNLKANEKALADALRWFSTQRPEVRG
jgi:hypothetical protein